MNSLDSWWWPKRPVRVPRARTAGLLAGLGALLFGVAAVLLKTGTTGWDESLFRLLNDVPAAATRVLTPLSRLVLPVGIAIVIVLIVGYVVVRNRSILPVAAGVAGIFMETHPRPEEALCDAAQQIPASEFGDFADEIRALVSLMGRTIG